MRTARMIAIAVIVLGASGAIAQSAPAEPAFALQPESVTVTSARPSEETIKNFVETRAAPTRFLGKMARWRREICPLTVGLGDKYAKYVTQRIREVATAVGAPVNADSDCKPNLEIVFTTAPQGFMDVVLKSGPAFLGYHDNSSQAEELAKVTHPIQAWYLTESLDYDGVAEIDRGQCTGMTSINTLPLQISGNSDITGPQGFIQLNLPCARIMHASGSRLNNGHDSGFYNVVILAEPAKLSDHEVGALADYISMLALSQPASLDACQELPSISNLLAKGCASASAKITDGDLAFLHGLYNTPSGYSMTSQQNEMRFQMKKTLVTDKGGQ